MTSPECHRPSQVRQAHGGQGIFHLRCSYGEEAVLTVQRNKMGDGERGWARKPFDAGSQGGQSQGTAGEEEVPTKDEASPHHILYK